MALEIPLETMTPAEKMAAVEAIWASLSQKPADVPAPAWHEKVLQDRQRQLASGETTVSDWDEAKRRLRDLGQ